jgi:phage terminase small subunit
MQRNWRSLTRELGCDPDDRRQLFDAMVADLARRW